MGEVINRNKTTEIESSDTIHHIAMVLKDLRNKKLKNRDDLTLQKEGVTYDDHWAVFTVSKLKNYFVQVINSEGNSVYAEVADKNPDQFKLSKHKITLLNELGWSKENSTNIMNNYAREYDVSDDTACYASAAEIVLTMIKVFDYRTYEPIDIEIDRWENNPDDIKEPSLLDNVKIITRNILLLITQKLSK